MFYLLFPFTLLLPSPSGERWKGRAVAPHWFCVVVLPHRADVSRRKDIVGGARPRSFCDVKCRGSRLFPKHYRTSHSCHNICSGRPGSSGACVHPEYSNHLLLVNTSFACRAGSPSVWDLVHCLGLYEPRGTSLHGLVPFRRAVWTSQRGTGHGSLQAMLIASCCLSTGHTIARHS